MTADLIAFLQARLDEDEAVARKALRMKVAAVVYRLLRDVRDGFWNGVDYIRFCRWMP